MWEHEGRNNTIILSDEAAATGVGVGSVHVDRHEAGIAGTHPTWQLWQISWKASKNNLNAHTSIARRHQQPLPGESLCPALRFATERTHVRVRLQAFESVLYLAVGRIPPRCFFFPSKAVHAATVLPQTRQAEGTGGSEGLCKPL